MCGIAGLAFPNHAIDPALVGRVSSALRHRGPDDQGFLGWHPQSGSVTVKSAESLGESRVALIHRRLSILDLSPAGAQPMTRDGRVHIVFNGEVYNYVELRKELEPLGFAFRTGTDTEVVLAAYQAWNTAAFERFTGMFALAILDEPARRLVLARDYFGIKPLYYAVTAKGLAFASEIKSLLEIPEVGRRVSPLGYRNYLENGQTDAVAQTLFEGVLQLPPGHLAVWNLDGGAAIEPECFWKLKAEPQAVSRKDAVEKTRQMFLDSVRLHLRSDVPVGSCLSGGVDSSSIVMVMRHLLGPGAEIHSFSYIPDDEKLSEEKWIDLVSDRAGTVRHKIRPAWDDLPNDLDRLIRAQDEPFGGLSMYAQHRVFQAASEQGIKVMLDGQGADELIGGYQGASRTAMLNSLVKRKKRWAALRFLWTMRRKGLEFNPPGSLSGLTTWLLKPLLGAPPPKKAGPGRWLDCDWFAGQGVKDVSKVPQLDTPEALRNYLWQATTFSSLPKLLRYEDRNSMAFSIESRVPFLTHEFAQWMLSLPEEYLVDRKGTAKSIFKEAMRGLVPDEILDRRDKIGFTTPIHRWLVHLKPWVEVVLESDCARSLPGYDLTVVRRFFDDVLAERKPFNAALWRVVNLVRWAEIYNPVFPESKESSSR